ncbi:MAG: hypothetical protein ABWK00_04800 [Desulfurococcaceae archaeon]
METSSGGAPTLIVTCHEGSDYWCTEEVGNYLFPKDPDVRVVRSEHPGVLFAYTRLDPSVAYRLLIGKEYGFVEAIVPVYGIASDIEGLEETLRALLKGLGLKAVKLRVKALGVRGLSSEIWRRARKVIEGLGIAHDPKSSTCLTIFATRGAIYVGHGLCKPPFKAGRLYVGSESDGGAHGAGDLEEHREGTGGRHDIQEQGEPGA